jgi:glycosyltransferase involved in cell wall biosynthesis
MRIVYLLTSLGVGGAERQTLAIAERMAQRGHSVALMVLRSPLAEEWPIGLNFELPVIRLGVRKSPASVLAGLARARRFLLDFDPDIVHSHSFHANLMARLLKLLVPAPAVLSTVHNVYEGGWHRMFAYRLTDPLSRRTTAVSQAVAERFIRLGAIPRHKCMTITNGIDAAEFSPDPSRRAEMRARLHAHSDFVWLAAGRLVPAKDFPNLLRAFAEVCANFTQTQLWIAGAAMDGGAKLAVSGRSDASPHSAAEDRVHWLGHRRDLLALLDAADAFVLSSAWEGMPLALAEAMAMEKPVVVTEVGGVRELVGDAASALVPPRDSRALAAAMLDLMRQEASVRHALGGAARERIRAFFSIDRRADDWEALYQSELLSGNVKRPQRKLRP